MSEEHIGSKSSPQDYVRSFIEALKLPHVRLKTDSPHQSSNWGDDAIAAILERLEDRGYDEGFSDGESAATESFEREF